MQPSSQAVSTNKTAGCCWKSPDNDEMAGDLAQEYRQWLCQMYQRVRYPQHTKHKKKKKTQPSKQAKAKPLKKQTNKKIKLPEVNTPKATQGKVALAVHKKTVHTAQNQAPANRKYGLTPGTPTTLTNPYTVEKPAHKDTNKTTKVG